MKIIIKTNQEIIEQKLRNYINSPINPIIFDITLDSTSHQILSPFDKNHYILSFSRPLFINVFNPPLAEYEFVFSLDADSLDDAVIVVGKVKLKKYIIGCIFLVFFILVYKIYSIQYEGAPINWFFLIVMPVVLNLYLVTEYFFFRRKVKKIINDLV